MNESIPALLVYFYIATGAMLLVGFGGAVSASLMPHSARRFQIFLLSLFTISVAAFFCANIVYYSSTNIVELSHYARWHFALFLLSFTFAWYYIAYSLRGYSLSRKLALSTLGLTIVLQVANLASPYSLHFIAVDRIDSFRSMGLSSLHFAVGNLSWPGGLAYAMLFFATLLLLQHSLPVWRQVSDKRLYWHSALIALMVLALVADVLVDLNVLKAPYLSSTFFFVMVFVSLLEKIKQQVQRAKAFDQQELQLNAETLQRRKAEDKLRRLTQVFMQAPMPTLITDLAGRTLQVNEESVRYLRRDASLPPKLNVLSVLEALGLERQAILDDLAVGKVREYGPYFFSAGVPADALFVVRDAWLKFKLYPIVNAERKLQEIAVRIEDVSEQQFVENAIKTISTAVSAEVGHAFFTQIVVYLARLLNKKYVFIGLKKTEEDETFIETTAIAVDGELAENFRFKLKGTASEQVLRRGVFSVARHIQQDFPESDFLQKMGVHSYLGAAITDKEKNPIGILAVMDIKPMEHIKQLQQIVNIFVSRTGTELQRLEAEKTIRKMAYEDYLTGLPNRTALNEFVLSLLNSPADENVNAFILLDIDHFKTINDALGHDIGDDVIRCLGRRLFKHCDDNMLVARLGGDEFAIVYCGLSRENLSEELDRLALRLTSLMERPVQVGDHLLDLGCTLGIVVFPDSASTSIDVFRSADIALYKAKNSGRGSYEIFSPKMREDVSERLNIEKGLRNALQNNELKLFYQPQINAQGELIGAEALIRWLHPEQGMISPMRFIPVAEESGLINAIGQWVLQTALATRKRWSELTLPFKGHLSVNVSAWQFARPDFVEAVKSAVQAADVPPSYITLEVTETVVLSDVKETIDKLSQLQRFGVTIALDDFGTGYSSLAYLRDLPLDILKIDKAFIDILETSPHEPLVESMITIGSHMGLEVVAEGVETPVQLERLKALGCNMFQGYLFSKPLPEEQFIDWLKNFDGYKNYSGKK